MPAMTYAQMFEMVETTIRHQSHQKFFKDGSARRAALAGLRQQEAGCGQEAIIDAVCDSLNKDSHICYFDDPCDAWRPDLTS